MKLFLSPWFAALVTLFVSCGSTSSAPLPDQTPQPSTDSPVDEHLSEVMSLMSSEEWPCFVDMWNRVVIESRPEDQLLRGLRSYEACFASSHGIQ